jgi:urease gamma subunit
MEAATPLRHPRITVLANRVLVDGLSIDDPRTVDLVRARVEAGDDPGRIVAEAVEIGARVLHREQTGANVEFVKAEFEKSARQLDTEFVERSRKVAERLDQKFEEAFGPENGHVSRALARHFGDDSSVAVQNRVKAMLTEASVQIREDLRKQFASDSQDNPLAVYQRASLAVVKQSSDQHAEQLRAMREELAGVRIQLERERAEKEKAEAVAQEASRGTAKGRSFEEAVYGVVDEIAVQQGDDCDAVGDVKGGTGKTGDVVVAIEGCTGPARGRIVFEAKASRLSKPKAIEELDRARTERNADFAVLVVPDEERIPAKMHQLREYGGDKLVVCFDPEEGSTLALEVAYGLARARVLMARGEAEGIDPSAIREAIERATGAMGEVLRVKQQLTGATTSIRKGADILDAMATAVRAQLMQVELLLAAAEPVEVEFGADAASQPAEAEPTAEAASPVAEPDPFLDAEPDPIEPEPAPPAAEPEPFPGAERLPF